MTQPQFNALKFGNIISEAGHNYMVMGTSKDASGNVVAIAVSDAFVVANAGALDIVSTSFNRTAIKCMGGEVILFGETIQGS